jgi:membrane protein implicated in regulation of membrane protease activity
VFYFLVFIVTLAWLALLTGLCMTLGLWVLPLIMLAVIAMFSVICGRDAVTASSTEQAAPQANQ